MNKRQKRLGNKGFSLVELIVVIAIMAVLVAVLAPTLIGKIEESRVSTDLSTVAEIKTQVTNMLANEDIYDELVDSVKTRKYTLTNKFEFTTSEAGVTTDKAEDELKTVLEKFTFQSKAAKEVKENDSDPDTVTVEINSKGKVYVYVAGTDGKPIKAGDQELAAGNDPSGSGETETTTPTT